MVRELVALGHHVEVFDRRPLEQWPDMGDVGTVVRCHGDGDLPPNPNGGTCFVSPAIPPSHPVHSLGYSLITTEIEWSMVRAARDGKRIHAVTGSVGKSTCATLMAALFGAEPYGNIGTPLLGRSTLPDDLVLELSSYQLHYLKKLDLKVDSWVLTPVKDHHASWHDSVESYRNCKLDAIESWIQAGAPGCSQEETKDLQWPWDTPMLGRHNLANLATVRHWALALGANGAIGMTDETIVSTLEKVSPLPHRLEIVSRKEGKTWVNDSKATSVAATLEALAVFEGSLSLILHGPTAGDVHALVPACDQRCSEVLLVGKSRALAEHPGWKKLRPIPFETLPQCLYSASFQADHVLLSPAGASEAPYRHYEERGDDFRRLLRQRLGSKED